MVERKINTQAFEAFLAHTNEKQETAKVLADLIRDALLKRSSSDKVTMLDIGAGTGLLTELYLGMLPDCLPEIDLTLLEPTSSYVEALRERTFKGASSPTIITASWEESSVQKQCDIIIASHLYHLKDDIYKESLHKMLRALKPGGVLLFVFRNVDDIYAFKEKIRPTLDLPFERNTAQKFLTFFEAFSDPPLSISTTDVEATLELPEETAELLSIIEFLLTISWESLTTDQQVGILQYLRNLRQHNKMTTSEKIIVVRFAPNS